MSKTIWHGQLNVGRKFKNDKEMREYFVFSGYNKNGKEFRHSMSDKQMIEFEDSIIRRIVKKILHSMR